MSMRVVENTPKYQKLLRTREAESAGLHDIAQIRQLPVGTYVLTGEKTANYGGGHSPYGFLVHNERILGRIKIDRAAVARGWL